MIPIDKKESTEFLKESVEYLEDRRKLFVDAMNNFNNAIKTDVAQNLKLAESKKKSKKTAVILAIPLLGLQWAYLKSPGYTFLSILLCWTIIVPVINLISLLKLLFMNEAKFDIEFNPEYVYYSQFQIKN